MPEIDARHHLALDPRRPDFVQDPYPAYAAMRQAAPLLFWEEFGCWCAPRHAEVSALLRDRRFGRQILHVTTRAALGWPEPAPHLAPFDAIERFSLLELEPPDHTRLRGLVNRAFVSRVIARLRPRITALTHALIDGFAADRQVELIQRFATPIPVTIIAELLGIGVERTPDLLDWSHRMVAMYQAGRTRAIEEDAASASTQFSDFIRAQLGEAQAEPDTLLGSLRAAQGEDRLSTDELVTTCILLLNAGHEATVHAIGNGVKALLEAPAALRRRLADPEQVLGLVEELLRYDTPLHMFIRYALEDLTYQGVALRQGDKIGLLLGSANRDQARFPDPDTLLPDRTPNPHLSFGAGIHFCVGAPLARLELEVALPILFARLPQLRLASPPRFRDTYHFRGLERLDLAW